MSYVRSLVASIRVGWSRDFGWTNPILGFSLKTIAPIASTMTALTILYIGFKNGASIASAQFPFLLGYIVIGATLYAHISAYSWVPTLAIAEGKWTFVFPQVYVHWGNSLRAHLRLLLGTNTSYSGGKMDICLSPSLRINKIVSAIPCW